MRFSDDFIEDVRQRNDIVDVISGYVSLTHKGTSYKGLCPFHNEKTPSFSVHKGRQMYHCFGCGASGDVFNFLMEYDRNTFSEAVETLARRAGMEIPQDSVSSEDRKEKSIKEKLLEIQKDAATFFYYSLYSPKGKQALDYLRGRGLKDEVIKQFGLGYSEKTGTGLYAYLKKKGYTDAELKQSGLFVFDEAKNTIRDKFWNRVMFPIMDQNRKVIGFGGRVMGDGIPKYLNSPETKIFEKSRNLYGLYAAKSSRKKYMILCEGYMDVITLHSAGFTNAVASLGTAFTSQQAALIHRYVKDVVLLYDSDSAGVNAARRAIPLLKEAGINPKSADLTPYKDPDEFIKALGAEALNERIDKAQNGFMYEALQMSKEYDTSDPQGRADFQKQIALKLFAFSDEIERNSYLISVAREYEIDADVLKREIQRLASSGYTGEKKYTEEEVVTTRNKRDPAAVRNEKILLSWMSQDIDTVTKMKKYLTEDDFEIDLHKQILKALFEMEESGNFYPVSILNRYEESEDKTETASILEGAMLPEKRDDIELASMEVLVKIKNQTYNRLLERAGSDPGVLQQCLIEKQKLEELKKV